MPALCGLFIACKNIDKCRGDPAGRPCGSAEISKLTDFFRLMGIAAMYL